MTTSKAQFNLFQTPEQRKSNNDDKSKGRTYSKEFRYLTIDQDNRIKQFLKSKRWNGKGDIYLFSNIKKGILENIKEIKFREIDNWTHLTYDQKNEMKREINLSPFDSSLISKNARYTVITSPPVPDFNEASGFEDESKMYIVVQQDDYTPAIFIELTYDGNKKVKLSEVDENKLPGDVDFVPYQKAKKLDKGDKNAELTTVWREKGKTVTVMGVIGDVLQSIGKGFAYTFVVAAYLAKKAVDSPGPPSGVVPVVASLSFLFGPIVLAALGGVFALLASVATIGVAVNELVGIYGERTIYGGSGSDNQHKIDSISHNKRQYLSCFLNKEYLNNFTIVFKFGPVNVNGTETETDIRMLLIPNGNLKGSDPMDFFNDFVGQKIPCSYDASKKEFKGDDSQLYTIFTALVAAFAKTNQNERLDDRIYVLNISEIKDDICAIATYAGSGMVYYSIIHETSELTRPVPEGYSELAGNPGVNTLYDHMLLSLKIQEESETNSKVKELITNVNDQIKSNVPLDKLTKGVLVPMSTLKEFKFPSNLTKKGGRKHNKKVSRKNKFRKASSRRRSSKRGFQTRRRA